MGLFDYLRGRDLWQRQTRAPLSPSGTDSATFAAVSGQRPPPSYAIQKKGSDPAKSFKATRPGRISRPSSTTILGSMAWLPRKQELASLDTLDMTRMTPEEVISIISNVSPEFAMACWNNVRLANSGYDVSVQKRNGSDDAEGLKIVQAFLARVNRNNWGGGLDPLLDSLHLCAFLGGAVCAETPPVTGLTDVEDIYPILPASLRFRWLNMGTQAAPDFRLALQQWVLSMHEPIWLNPEQTVFVPLDAMVDDPYGRPPAFAAIGAILFWLDLLRDLRRVLHTNSWGRLKVKVFVEVLRQNAPPEVLAEEDKWQAYLEGAVEKIASEYANMEPDDSVIFTDLVDVGQIEGSHAAFQIDPLLRSVETLIIRGLKQLPTLMGGVSSRGAAALGTLEYQITSSGIVTFQRMSAEVMNFACNLQLRLHGRQSRASFEWQPIRTTDRLKDAQAEALEIQNASRKRDEGWIDQAEAAFDVTGHEPVAPDRIHGGPVLSTTDRPSPPPMPTNDQNPADGLNPNAKQPSVGTTTGEGGDQIGAPQPAPSRWLDEAVARLIDGDPSDEELEEVERLVRELRSALEA